MFGNFLVCPVTYPMSEMPNRKIYLPKGCRWTDYHTGQEYNGGQWIEVESKIDILPLFTKCGSIIITTETAEHTGAQIGKPVTINVYPGNEADFCIYEDEGDNYNYERGRYSVIPLTWNDKKRTLTIGNRSGSFTGMQQERTFIVKTPHGSHTVKYNGKKTVVKF